VNCTNKMRLGWGLRAVEFLTLFSMIQFCYTVSLNVSIILYARLIENITPRGPMLMNRAIPP
jgi:hypothetical protein